MKQKKLIKIYLLFLLLTTMAFTSETGTFNLKVKNFFNEHRGNPTKIKINKDFEALLPYYLKIENLFSLKSCEISVTQNNISMKYVDFFIVLRRYTLLQSQDSEIYRNLVDKMLYDFHSLMINSNNLIDYMISLQQLTQLMNALTPSTKLAKIIKNYPLPSEDILFEKLLFEKNRTVSRWKELGMTNDTNISYSKESVTKLKDEISRELENVLNEAYRLEKLAIKNASPQLQEQYKVYMKSVKNKTKNNEAESNSKGTTTKRALHVATKLLLISSSDTIDTNLKTYQAHKDLVKRYRLFY
jgi:hypothetical protein